MYKIFVYSVKLWYLKHLDYSYISKTQQIKSLSVRWSSRFKIFCFTNITRIYWSGFLYMLYYFSQDSTEKHLCFLQIYSWWLKSWTNQHSWIYIVEKIIMDTVIQTCLQYSDHGSENVQFTSMQAWMGIDVLPIKGSVFVV